jgi:capsular exopolysaccharide synthesis family protein
MQQIHLEKLYELDFASNEAYKTLRTNIQFCGSDVRMICFTSCLPNEGKSNVSFNLAVSFAESGKKVIFVDADLRRSIIVGRYKPDQAVQGLAHFLSGQNTFEEIIYETNIDYLDMIFTGPVPPNPAELLGSDLFIKLIRMLREEYDYVIIDTPPLANVIDSAIVAKQCDGVVLVIEANAISYKLAQKVKKQLEKGNCRILGAVLNKVQPKNIVNRYYGKKYKKYEKSYYSYY